VFEILFVIGIGIGNGRKKGQDHGFIFFFFFSSVPGIYPPPTHVFSSFASRGRDGRMPFGTFLFLFDLLYPLCVIFHSYVCSRN
jgi:hypothetical protein